MKTHLVLVERYLSYIKTLRPDVTPQKNPEGSLSLQHALWMLLKMKEEGFVPKTSNDSWLSWVQASLYSHGLIVIKHEIDITREILNQQPKE